MVPYALWGNRGDGAMRVWVPRACAKTLPGSSVGSSSSSTPSDLAAGALGGGRGASGARASRPCSRLPQVSFLPFFARSVS